MDNYATPKHAKVKAWLAKHPRFHLHFVPTGSSWLNLVERFFRDLYQFQVKEIVYPGLAWEVLLAEFRVSRSAMSRLRSSESSCSRKAI